MPVVLGTTGRVAWVTDARGEDAVQIAPVGVGTVPPTGTPDTSGPTGTPVPTGAADRLAEGALGTVLELVASPDGAVLAIAVHDGRVLTLDPATGAVSEVARTTEGDVSGLTFSQIPGGWPGRTPVRSRWPRSGSSSCPGAPRSAKRSRSPRCGSPTPSRRSPPTACTSRSCPSAAWTPPTTPSCSS